jgi:recombination protein RecT
MTNTDVARAAIGMEPRGNGEEQPKTALDIRRDQMVARIQRYKPVFIDLFSDKDAGARFVQDAYNTLRTTPQLAQCTPESFMGGLVWAAQCRLRVAGPFGHCWLLPFKDHGVYVATFVLGYKGVVTLGWRSGVQIMADTIYRNEKHKVARGLHEVLEHEPILDAPNTDKLAEYRGDPIIHYAIARAAATGLTAWRPISHADALYARDHSKSYIHNPAKSPWTDHLIPMCQKTGVHRLAPYIPTDSEELVIPLQTDDSVQLVDDADNPNKVTLTRMSEDDAAAPAEEEAEPQREVIDLQPTTAAQPPADAPERDAAKPTAAPEGDETPAESRPRQKAKPSKARTALFAALRDHFGDPAVTTAALHMIAGPGVHPDYVTDDELRKAVKLTAEEVAAWQEDQAMAAIGHPRKPTEPAAE